MDAATPASIQDRAFQVLLIVSTLALSWLGMMVVHEFGHALFAWLSGGSVAKVVLHPLLFSRTDLAKNPHPLFVASGGALVGVTAPLLVWVIWRKLHWPGWYVWQFFGGFCLVVNGIYVGVVSFLPHTADPGDMMREGLPHWVLVVFGIVATPSGLWLWNGLGPQFGLGKTARRIDQRVAVAMFFSLLGLIAAELLTFSR